MPTEFQRPDSVPAAAEWVQDAGHWELVNRNAQGQPEGPFTWWRPDGTLLLEAHYQNGVLEGSFRRYHRTGQLAREGRYVAGAMEGVVVAHAGEGNADSPLRSCCVPPGATKMEARYASGGLQRETFFDAEGFALLPNGQRRPERPQHVPELADFDSTGRRWSYGREETRGDEKFVHSTWWREDGSLSEEADYQDGRRLATRHFDEAGQLKESIAYLAYDGYELIVHGPWSRRLTGEECCVWAGPSQPSADVWLHGTYDHAQSVGQWQLKHGEEVVWQRMLGVAFAATDSQTQQSVALFGATADCEVWMDRARALKQEDRVREALVALARAVGMGGASQFFIDELQARALPKAKNIAEQEARRLGDADECKVSDALQGLVGGAEPAECLRLLSTSLYSWSDAARDLVEASIVLNPSRTQSLLARAFVRLERAEDEGLLADVQLLDAVSLATGDYFREALKTFRPSYGFAPHALVFPQLSEPVDLAPTQSLERVQEVARIYATRLLHLREALLRYVAADKGWLPPDLGAWLLEGPVALRCCEAHIEDEDEDGNPELTTVHIDERLALQNMGVSALIRRARADWVGLCWLLWAVGQDDVRWPAHVAARPEYPQALSLAVERAWRARDQGITGGLRSINQGLGEFVWEGQNLSQLPRNLLEVCLDEYLEMRAALLWLSNPGNISPFQNDLRQV